MPTTENEDMLERFDRIETKIDQLDARLGSEIGALDARLSNEIGGLDVRLSSEIGGLDARLSSAIGALDARLTSEIGGLEARLTETFEARARKTEMQFEQLRDDMKTLVGNLDAKIDGAVLRIEESQRELNAKWIDHNRALGNYGPRITALEQSRSE